MLLTNDQKREIAQLAHAAWTVSPSREGMIDCNPDLSLTRVEAAWRHVEQGRVMGGLRQSLREATQRDYPLLRAHFLRLQAEGLALHGQAAAAAAAVESAEKWTVRAATDGVRRARHLLRRALEEAGLREGYAAAICRTQNKCSLDEASEKQLWRLIFTVRNRRKPVAKSPGAHEAAGAEGSR